MPGLRWSWDRGRRLGDHRLQWLCVVSEGVLASSIASAYACAGLFGGEDEGGCVR